MADVPVPISAEPLLPKSERPKRPTLPKPAADPGWLNLSWWGRPEAMPALLIVVGLACQLLLMVPFISESGGLAARAILRSAPFAFSLLALVFLPGRGPTHPSARFAQVILMILGFSLLHPTGNWPAAPAHAAMYLAILAPIFWAGRCGADETAFRRILLIAWGFHSLSANVGILQVYFPGYLQPPVSTVVLGQKDYIEGLKIIKDDGTAILRPMGLTDVPGGAAMSGMYAVIFSIGFVLGGEKTRWIRAASLLSICSGFACLYLCQVRSILVMVVFSIIAIWLGLLTRGEARRASFLAILAVTVSVGSLFWAIAMGGQSTWTRLESLWAEDPTNVYYSNRGHFFEYTVYELLPTYPMGAGLGRWGMMFYYFGTYTNPEAHQIWVEINWTGWLLDGGLPMVLMYPVALTSAGITAWLIGLDRSLDRRSNLWVWGIVINGYDIAVSANTFNYSVFIGQSGLEFWMLNGVLWATYHNLKAEQRAERELLELSSKSSVRRPDPTEAAVARGDSS